jgi:hypothetical protein
VLLHRCCVVLMQQASITSSTSTASSMLQLHTHTRELRKADHKHLCNAR